MYLDKSSNQAEVIKCFESVLEHDGQNLEAIERLKEMYEKRRDWESLVRVRAHIYALPRRKAGRAHMVEEHPGAHRPALGGRQGAPHRKTAQILVPWRDDQLHHISYNFV